MFSTKNKNHLVVIGAYILINGRVVPRTVAKYNGTCMWYEFAYVSLEGYSHGS